jgi:phosphinothricin acetyltransferase
VNLKIESMQPHDWEAVRAIYEEGIDTGQATFETAVPSWEEWDAGKLADPRLVIRLKDTIVGWAALSPVSKRPVYAGIAEVSIYVAADVRGRGVGKALLRELISRSERCGLWMLQAVMFPENRASVALHRACGFRIVGIREKIGRHHGIWRDTIFLERRSQIVGQDFLPREQK